MAKKRHITPKECARIQSFDVDGVYGKPFVLGDNDAQAYKQLGNAVNVNMIYEIQGRIDEFLSGSPDFPRKPRVQTKLKFEQLEKESSTEISLQDPVVNGDKVVSGGTKIYSQTNQTIVGLGYNEIENY